MNMESIKYRNNLIAKKMRNKLDLNQQILYVIQSENYKEVLFIKN